jgi:hypothetical protein
MDMALLLEKSGEPIDEILARHEVSVDDMTRFNKDPLFVKKVGQLRADVRERGMTFRLKARMQAEELLLTSWKLIHDFNTSAAVKADLIKSTVRWAGLEVKDAIGGDTASGVSITINLGNNDPKKLVSLPVIEHNDTYDEYDEGEHEYN